jgi:hypothetical protein
MLSAIAILFAMLVFAGMAIFYVWYAQRLEDGNRTLRGYIRILRPYVVRKGYLLITAEGMEVGWAANSTGATELWAVWSDILLDEVFII